MSMLLALVLLQAAPHWDGVTNPPANGTPHYRVLNDTAYWMDGKCLVRVGAFRMDKKGIFWRTKWFRGLPAEVQRRVLGRCARR